MDAILIGFGILVLLGLAMLIVRSVLYIVLIIWIYFVSSLYPSNVMELHNFVNQQSNPHGGFRCQKLEIEFEVRDGDNPFLPHIYHSEIPIGMENCHFSKSNNYFGEPTIPEFVSTSRLILDQFRDLIRRLNTLYNSRETLLQKYGSEHVGQINEDIARLSSLGGNLAVVTRRFLEQVKVIEAQKEILAVRKNALSGLKTFTVEIDKVNQMVNSPDKDKSFEAVTAQIEKAVRELEKEIQK